MDSTQTVTPAQEIETLLFGRRQSDSPNPD